MANIYYYMTWDSNADRPWDRGIPMDAIRSALDGIPARQKILLIDTCQSGEKVEIAGFTPSGKLLEEIRVKRGGTRGKNTGSGIRLSHRGKVSERSIALQIAQSMNIKEMSEMFPELRRGAGTIEISAATGVQSALESSEWKNGAFTFAVKEALLEGKARDEKGQITAGSLRRYVLDRVEKLTEGAQTPIVGRDIAGRDFIIVGK
jgi:hypothetical protein